jgi:superfamily II DNA or RNA helicase
VPRAPEITSMNCDSSTPACVGAIGQVMTRRAGVSSTHPEARGRGDGLDCPIFGDRDTIRHEAMGVVAVLCGRPRRQRTGLSMSTNQNRTTRGNRREAGDLAGRVPSFAVLRPDQQLVDPMRPFAHQLEAWEALTAANEEWERTGILEGLIVMPTASGKTFTAMAWALKEVVGRGQGLLWLAHSDLLLEQAAATAHRAVGSVEGRSHVAIRIVSGAHCSVSQIEPTDDVVVCSIPSLLRDGAAASRLLHDPGLLVAVDEAHRAAAGSYRELLGMLPAAHRLVGLTATPTRTRRDERPLLASIFGDRTIYRVDHDLLVERGILARPVPIRVSTGVNLDGIVGRRDIEQTGRFEGLSDGALARLERIEARNQVIVDHYLPQRGRYGKTLLFVNSVRHAALLADRMTGAGARADYVAASRPDRRSNRSILDRFRDPDGDLDVIVCVLKLAEGVDLPKTQTVFLACPTGSEIRLRQMLGRALRGPAVGGTELAYLVVFQDDCDLLGDRLDPFKIVPDLMGAGRSPARRAEIVPTEPPSWQVALDVARSIRRTAPSASTRADEAVPGRWFILRPGGPAGAARVVLAYGHQLAGWIATVSFLEGLAPAELDGLDGGTLLDRFFADVAWLRPRVDDLDDLIGHFRADGSIPESCDVESRNACAPSTLARIIWTDDLGEQARTKLIREWHGGLAAVIYPTLRSYIEAVNDELFLLANPRERGASTGPTPVFEVQAYGRSAARTRRGSTTLVNAARP